MRDLIQLLPDAIANQIAAGEVVQRPASVVKELMENAIDAQATYIQLIIKDAGKGLIQVIDNGTGMSETDARMCFERHATSKIKKAEDLFSIKTMGFRGEAMASIASVAQVELKTRREQDELGTLVRIEASVLKVQESIQQPLGTSITVKNLFYNIPARRNFLKSNPVEIRHILDEFQHIALAHPNIQFSFVQNDQETYQLPAEKLGKRIVDLFGKGYREQLASCEEDTSYVCIKGYVGKPEHAKKTRGEQFFFVNDRYIKNAYLNHAVMSAYERLLPEGAFPFYVLFLSIDPSHIDINVHPTKTEIKFDDERSIYAIVQAAVRKTLSIHNLIPSLDFDTNVNFNIPHIPSRQAAQDRSSHFSPNTSSSHSNKNVQDAWKKLYEGLQDNIQAFEQQAPAIKAPLFEQPTYSSETILQSRANQRENTEFNTSNFQVIQILQKYLALSWSNGLILIDQKRAYQRILYDQFMDHLQRKNGASQQLLFPKLLHISPADQLILEEIKEDLLYLGFQLALEDGAKYWVKGIPAGLGEEDGQSLLEGILEQVKHEASDLSKHRNEKIAQAMSNRSAIRYQQKKLSSEEMTAMVEQLFASSNPNSSPNGEQISRALGLQEIINLLH
ncbi:DNA mismatch repair endonuclease MutL [Aquirufa ecclesiirivi]|uniref:DNA mismatch repair endonuclease MutL n=1 Tax=Aquirufa ecclesiirivi TaxID=2715124 RepID=UPI0023D7BF6D|nr:DNA mismatch repair endonuclease MutL [Aquirufa ecclesiirivi]MDF0693597.1 DNA mismatch repair endonuclease MutL [Aquirufa ecclesiirivi]